MKFLDWWYWDSRNAFYRWRADVLDFVPKSMRSWPILRRWYWQPEEIEEANRQAKELAKSFGTEWQDEPRQ